MAKKEDKRQQPPSLFDNLDLFGAADGGAEKAAEAADTAAADTAAADVTGKASADAAAAADAEGKAAAATAGGQALTGTGPLRNLMNGNFLEYTAYVICSRAIPAVEDGLKPVQRRILHSLWEMDDGRFTKVANVVGHAMQYHPHGDASIGDALVVLANRLWGEGMGYLIQGQGNFGNLFTGMPAAAPRYIECQLSELARKEVFNEKTTDFVPSYDGRNQEPVLLPAKVPLLLMMGADGIAVGLSTAILPHNFIELLEAEIAILHKKPFTIYPDFQLGGIMDVSEYADGLGKVRVRAVIEPRDKNKLVITEMPWGETTDSIAESIEDAIRKKKVQVRKLHDLTSAKVEIELELQTGADQDKVKTQLFAFTNCEKSISSRPVVLDGGRPREMTVGDILRRNVERLTSLTKRELEIRLGELDDLFHARTLDRIFVEERIYKRIESEKTFEGVQKAVTDGFVPFRRELRRDVTAEDVDRLLKLQIRRISQFDIDKNRRDIENVLAEEKEVRHHLEHLRAYVTDYLKRLVKAYRAKYPRMTRIAAGAFKQVDVRAITASELSIRFDRENHFLGSAVKGGDELFRCSSLDRLLVVWKDGRYKMMPPADKTFVDKDVLTVTVFNPDKDRTREFTCVYEEPDYGFSYVKRFTFGGMINNREYRLAPPKSKILFFQAGCPETLYVKYKPAKGQKIHQQYFLPAETVKRVNPATGREEAQSVVTVRGASARGKQLTTKPIHRVASAKGSWWSESEPVSKGVLD